MKFSTVMKRLVYMPNVWALWQQFNNNSRIFICFRFSSLFVLSRLRILLVVEGVNPLNQDIDYNHMSDPEITDGPTTLPSAPLLRGSVPR